MYTKEQVKSDLARRVAKAMYMRVEELDEDELFSDFGLESVTLVKILGEVCGHYGCTITIRDLLAHQTLREAAELIYLRVEEQAGAESTQGRGS